MQSNLIHIKKNLPNITPENDYNQKSAQIYMGATQIKQFASCAAQALARLRGEWQDEFTAALMIGSYVDAHYSGTLDIFKARNPQIFKKDGSLKSDYEHANSIIRRIERDPVMMEYLTGETQAVMVGEIEGVPVKIRMDFFLPGKRIVDLKIMRSFDDIWVDGMGKKSFVTAWGYDIQAAIYPEIERQNREGSTGTLPFFIAGATKEKETDIGVFSIPQVVIDEAMMIIRNNIEHYDNIKQGAYEPERCEKCASCKSTKVLTGPVDFRMASRAERVF